MTPSFDLVLRHARLADGSIVDIGIAAGRFAAIEPQLGKTDCDIDCQTKLLLPGLHDHHIHLLATAAQIQSVDLAGITSADAVAMALRAKAAELELEEWVRATGYDERVGGIADRHALDRWIADRPVRVQDRTGALWLLNSAALARIGAGPWPDCVETGHDGAPTGRIWRGDAWLRDRIGTTAPSLAALSRQLAHWGVTAVTDAGAQNGPAEAAILSKACRDGDLVQQLTMMGREDLPQGDGYATGPVKLLFDERDFPDPMAIAARIETARCLGRPVAAHCVTEAELVFYLAALDLAGGARRGDRIEHGSLIPLSLIADIAAARLTVVANPGFIAKRGDRYLAEIEAEDLPDLHRLASLADAGIRVLAGSDAPYGPPNPWVLIRAAIDRKAPSSVVLGADEAVNGRQALGLLSGDALIEKGARADCCVVDADWAGQLERATEPDPVQLSLIGGELFNSRICSRGR